MDEITELLEATEKLFLEKQNRLAEELGYTATAECKAVINECLLPLAEFIDAELHGPPRKTKLPVGLDIALRRLSLLHPNGAYVIAISSLAALLDSIWRRDDEEAAPARATREQIGQAIFVECLRLRKVLTKGGRRFRSRDWSRPEIVHAGIWLEDCIARALPDVFTHVEGTICIREEAIDRAIPLVRHLMLRNPVLVPGRNPPAPWTGFRDGGYWTQKSPVSAPFVRTHDHVVEGEIRGAIADRTLQPHLDAVNAQQAVPWKINERVLAIVNDFGPYEDDDRPQFLADMAMAEHLKGRAFYIPKNVDWRGRFYGIPRFNFERQDRVRALFKFQRGREIGEDGLYWLKIYTATTGDFDGISKKPFTEREAWVDKNLEKIYQINADPINTENWWAKAGKKKKYQFLAACIELSEAVRFGTKFVSRLPVQFDASASGI